MHGDGTHKHDILEKMHGDGTHESRSLTFTEETMLLQDLGRTLSLTKTDMVFALRPLTETWK